MFPIPKAFILKMRDYTFGKSTVWKIQILQIVVTDYSVVYIYNFVSFQETYKCWLNYTRSSFMFYFKPILGAESILHSFPDKKSLLLVHIRTLSNWDIAWDSGSIWEVPNDLRQSVSKVFCFRTLSQKYDFGKNNHYGKLIGSTLWYQVFPLVSRFLF